jgi:hypothetical protein
VSGLHDRKELQDEQKLEGEELCRGGAKEEVEEEEHEIEDEEQFCAVVGTQAHAEQWSCPTG